MRTAYRILITITIAFIIWKLIVYLSARRTREPMIEDARFLAVNTAKHGRAKTPIQMNWRPWHEDTLTQC